MVVARINGAALTSVGAMQAKGVQVSSVIPPTGLGYLRALVGNQTAVVWPDNALDAAEPPGHEYLHRAEEVLVTTGHAARFEELAGQEGLRCSRSSETEVAPGCGVAHYRVQGADSVEELLKRVEGVGDELEVSPNHLFFGCPRWGYTPDDEPQPYPYASLERTPGGAGEVTVAVIDSGLPRMYEYNELLAPVKVYRPAHDQEEAWTYASKDIKLRFPQGHGAFVAGVVRRFAPEARVVAYMALDSANVIDQAALLTRIGVALDHGPHVINLSLGTTTRGDRPPLGFGPLAAAAQAPGGPIVVAAAGNTDHCRRFWPAAEPWAIAVGAVALVGEDGSPTRAAFSNYGDWVDVCAEGVDVVSAYEAHQYEPSGEGRELLTFDGAAKWSGTSFAAPRVAARVAQQLATSPGLTRDEVLARLAGLDGRTVPGVGVYVP